MNNAPGINTSPLIFLAKAGYIDLLLCLHHEIVIPTQVYNELMSKPSDQITIDTILRTKWLKCLDTGTIPPVIQAWDLGIGESSVLTWGYLNSGTEVIIDDLAGRRCAHSLGIPVRGTLGIVLKAKQTGMIPLAKPVIDELIAHGMYLSDSIVQQTLALVGETL